MANERNNTALEFETMLRRHLKSGGAPVAACAGFDFDAASAYLENEIVAARRVGYESHLAGCATCRRHLIELSRLAQTAPHAGTQPVRVADRTPAWVRWREVVVGWFDLPAWNLKWQMVGAAGAAFAILIAALGVQSWRQASKPAGIVASAPIPPTTSVDSNPQAPAPEASPDGTPFLIAGNSVADRQGQSRPSVPLPLVGPKDGEREVAAAPAPDSLSLPSSQPSEPFSFDFGSRRDASGDAQQGKDAVRQNRISPQKSPTPLPNNLHNLSRPDLAISRARAQDATDSASRSSGNELATRITPPSKINPMNSGLPELEPRLRTLTSHDGQTAPANPGPPEPGSRIKPQPEKSSSRLKLKTLSEIRRSFLPGSKSDPKSDPKSESEQKKKPEASDDESFKTLKLLIRDKVFHYNADLNLWIDQEYKEKTMLFRVSTLRRGSKEYEQVLANQPQLKEFFDRAPILIVWRNEIYKVR